MTPEKLDWLEKNKFDDPFGQSKDGKSCFYAKEFHDFEITIDCDDNLLSVAVNVYFTFKDGKFVCNCDEKEKAEVERLAKEWEQLCKK